jgi:L-lactate dehydrogenase (cytochrome)
MRKASQQLMNQYPGIANLEEKAQRRLPNVAWEYLQSGTGNDGAMHRNRQQLEKITLTPRFMQGKLEVDLSTELFGTTYRAPFGIAPVGLTGLIWPKAECILAETAREYGIPYTLSTVATQTPETVGPLVGNMGWFQLYPPKDPDILRDLLKRARAAGFTTLLITADVPAPGRREKSKKAGLTIPPKITPRLAWEGITHPVWLWETLRAGLPRLKTVAPYSTSKDSKAIAEFARFRFRGDLDWDYIKNVRDLWSGPIVLKGILHPDDALQAIAIGVDGIGVSNHGGRQFDGAPAAIDVLPDMAAAVNGKARILFDSGIRSGLDILRALSQGADFVLCGKAFMYGCAALGKRGGYHTADILIDDLTNNMQQLGVRSVAALRNSHR